MTTPEEIPKKTKEVKEILEGKNPEKKLPKLIGTTNREVRENIGRCFNEMYPETGGIDKFIQDKIKDQNMQPLIEALFDERSTTEAKKLAEAIGIFSVDEEPVYEMLFNYPKWLKDEIKKKYKKLTGKSLRKDLEDSFIEPIRSNVDRFLSADRETDPTIRREQSENLCKLLSENHPKTWMENKDIMEAFADLSPEELILAGRLYAKEKDGEGLMDAIRILPESQKKFLENCLGYFICPPLKYVERIKKILDTKKCTDYEIQKKLMDIIQSRSDVDLALINKFYMMKNGTSMKDDFSEIIPDYAKSPVYNLLNVIISKGIYDDVYKKK